MKILGTDVGFIRETQDLSIEPKSKFTHVKGVTSLICKSK